MRNFTLMLIALLIVAFTANAQEGTAYTDDFSAEIDYLTAGVDGTIWDGILLNSGLWDMGEIVAEITALNTTDNPGTLTFASMNSHWAVGSDNGAAIYRTVKNGADFEVQVKIAGGDFLSFGLAELVPYHMPGIIAKVADDTTFILIQVFDIQDWSAVIGMRDIVPAGDLLQENWQTGFTLADNPYIKLEKYENLFTGYYSADGVVWNEIYSVEKPEFAGKDIQVGLYSATYTESVGTVHFDDYSMVDYNEPGAVNVAKELSLKAFYSNGAIRVSSSSNLGNVKVYRTDGSLFLSRANVNSSQLSIPVQNKGIYLLSCESAGEVQTQKVLVY
ncbi:MAG: T9SS type A sorting domain-containing protein [Prolixibacteraceae bacterium]|nr:T9SS type A sorting domain-containing protein [Prolixibacteraceae bacterium]